MLEERRLCLVSVTWSRHQLVMRFAFDELSFSTVTWYPDIDLLDLDRRFGRDFMERLHVHTALFEINKLASLRPRLLDLGPYAHHHTRALEPLWKTVFHKVWAQWRYQHDRPGDEPPPWASRPFAESASPRRRDRDAGEVLLFCGGGKDSLVAMRLLERGNIPFASLAYTSSVYGAAEPQRALLDRLLDKGAARHRHRQIVLEDFFDAPVIPLYGEALGVRSVTAAETPSSIFSALPILLAQGYDHAVMGHEASANTGNLTWDRTGEDVNHQWGKSIEAERLLDHYLRAELCEDVGVFSLLMPLHDVAIFSLLRRDEGLSATHSCNVKKPWCCRCAKCAYVWLGYRAHLDDATVSAMFPEDLLEAADNHRLFHDLVGLGLHTPFECVGHVDESRLALSLCRARGLLGPRGLALADRLPPLDVPALMHRFLRVDLEGGRLPARIAAAVAPTMHEAVAEARTRITKILGGGPALTPDPPPEQDASDERPTEVPP